jgi:hypothetical protein
MQLPLINVTPREFVLPCRRSHMVDAQAHRRRWHSLAASQVFPLWLLGKYFLGWGIGQVWIAPLAFLIVMSMTDANLRRLPWRLAGAAALVAAFQFGVPALGLIHEIGIRIVLIMPFILVCTVSTFLMISGGFELEPRD